MLFRFKRKSRQHHVVLAILIVLECIVCPVHAGRISRAVTNLLTHGIRRASGSTSGRLGGLGSKGKESQFNPKIKEMHELLEELNCASNGPVHDELDDNEDLPGSLLIFLLFNPTKSCQGLQGFLAAVRLVEYAAGAPLGQLIFGTGEIPRRDEDLGLRIELPDLFEGFKTIHASHAVIHDDEIRLLTLIKRHALFPICSKQHVETEAGKYPLGGPSYHRRIVND